MKRFLLVLITLVLSVGFLFANGSKESASAATSGAAKTAAPVAITFGIGTNADGIKSMKQVIALYEKSHPNATVNLQAMDPGGFVNKLPVMFRSGSAPDVINVSNGWVPSLETSFQPFLSLDSYLSQFKLVKDQYVPGSWDDYTVGGHLYALPNVAYGDAIAYNADLFKKYNVPLPKPGWTTADFVRDAKMITHGTGQDKIWGVSEAVFARNLPQLLGGNLVDYKTNKVQATSPKVVEAVKFEMSLIKDGVMPQSLVFGKSVDPFFAGHAGMDLFYVEYFQGMYNSQIGNKFKWNIAPFPVGWQGVRQTSGNAVWANSKEKPAAIEFAKWLSQDPAALRIEAGGGGSPVFKTALQAFEQNPPEAFKGIDVQNAISMIGRSVFVDQTGTYGQVWRNWLQTAGNIQTGADIMTTLQQYQTQAQALLNSQG